ncbi:Ribosomal L1 domain-containing protein 1 [Seminavis robusta]|uniref:Ribosomal L1 domain-containing protein 1 n=1 Tax=Seminavis robusta TaxID=568900 RepID=A0A9N8DWI7_9STRA|nr:Ribosomal L1 domain-containing protein 1 [Seminavis robusta]|eukprot:Sro429_g141150.1 Ribosomal L1 domain-containing protein 1 (479) ;mRNA; r:51759-53298
MGAKKQSGTKRKAQDVSQQAEVKTHVDKALAQKAVSALLQYHAKQQDASDKNQLPLGNDDRPIHVQFGLERASNPNSFKPMRIMIPNPIHLLQNTTSDNTSTSMDGPEEPEVCLIVKDSAKAWIQEMRFSPELAKELKMVKKVLTLTDVRQKYARYHQRRELLHLYNVFMADDRILPMLTAALGKDFVKAKKLPLPLRVTQNGLPFAIRNNLSSTFLTVGGGTSVSVRAGTTAMPEEKLVENILAVSEGAGDKLPRAWANIRTIAIKTPESTSLPLYHCLPQELQEIAEQAGIDEKKKMEEEEAKATKENVADSAAMNSPLVKALKKRKKEGSAKKEAKEEKKTDAESSAKKEKERTMKEKEDASPKAEKTEGSAKKAKKDGSAKNGQEKQDASPKVEKTEGSAKKAKKDGSAKKEKKNEDVSPEVEKTPQGSAKKDKKDGSAKKEKKKDSPKGGSAKKEKKDSSAKKDRKKKRSLSQ